MTFNENNEKADQNADKSVKPTIEVKQGDSLSKKMASIVI